MERPGFVPIPEVTKADVLRVIRRDFPPDQWKPVLKMLRKYGRWWHGLPERDRVRLAILKLSRGDIRAVPRYVKVALGDFRDVLVRAESPGFCKVGMSDVEKLSRSDLDGLLQEDWRQYETWLVAESKPKYPRWDEG